MVKLNLGCGKSVMEGFEGVDTIDFGQKHILNLGSTPWPWADESVEEAHASHFLEHLDATERIFFFNELYRVLKKDGKCAIITPYWRSGRAFGDLTHKWPPVVEMFYYYLDKEWRKLNAPHVPFTCDFATTWVQSFGHPWTIKSRETQEFALAHYSEVALDLYATTIKQVRP